MDDEFRIVKQRIEASVELQGGTRLSGGFLCAPRSEHHAGRETVADLLNEPSRFVPFFADGSEQPMLLNKNLVRVVKLAIEDLPGDPERLADFSSPREVVLRLDDGKALEGTAHVAAPVGHTRTLDLLNEPSRFVHVDCDDSHLIVNLDAVVSVEEG